MNYLNYFIIFFGFLLLFLLLSRTHENFNNTKFDDLMFTDYKKDFTCSKWLDNLPKHVRLNNSGGIMYISHKPPYECHNCRIIRCPTLIKDDITPNFIDHYNPQYKNHNMTCWQQ